mmetsp:Transcript_43125/g.108938  ORF Transcript_43125/g.108938 Transcript_43125/m.108938 type:complete len:280 (-) Transcript_43125:275-1114(-)
MHIISSDFRWLVRREVAKELYAWVKESSLCMAEGCSCWAAAPMRKSAQLSANCPSSAYSMGRLPSASASDKSAPRMNRRSMQDVLPIMAARCTGVRFWASRLLGRQPFWRRNSATMVLPHSTAQCRRVMPFFVSAREAPSSAARCMRRTSPMLLASRHANVISLLIVSWVMDAVPTNALSPYLARIKRSRSALGVLDDIFKLKGSRVSYTVFTLSLPISDMIMAVSGSHTSKARDRTFDMWVPRLRCTPEQSTQMTAPMLILHHSGAAAPQSAQAVLLF